MERSLARATHCPSWEHRMRFWTPSTLPCKCTQYRRRSHVSCSSYLKSGLNQAYTNGKKNTAGFSGQAEDTWNMGDDEEILRLMDGFQDSLPIIRTYKNDLCTLEICGSAPRSSVLTAMAADKSYFAASNLLMRRPLTVRQTVLPGACGIKSTIATKLLAPSLQVVERAKKLSLPKGLSTGEFMPKFFEAVEMLHLSKFYVEVNAPGTSRDMSTFNKEEEIRVCYSFEASNIGALNHFGEGLTSYASFCLQYKANENQFHTLVKKLWNKPQWVPSQTSPVRFRFLSVEEIMDQIKHMKASVDYVIEERTDRLWWPVPAIALETAKGYLEKATDYWIYEHVPMHKMHIDQDVLDNQGAKDDAQPRQSEDFVLTHTQLVDLAGVFDLYYEDRFTLSNKDFQSNPIVDISSVPRSKTDRLLGAMVLGGTILGVAMFTWLVSSRLREHSKRTAGKLVLNTVDVTVISKTELPSVSKHDKFTYPVNKQLPLEELEFLCKSVITKLVEAFGWNVEIQSHPLKGAWTESQSSELRGPHDALNVGKLIDYATKETANPNPLIPKETMEDHTTANHSEKETKDLIENMKEIPVYQVALSRNGTLVGFQPLNEAAISSWAAMPFAQSLHNVKHLKPGLWERPLNLRRPPDDVIVLELQVDEGSLYAFTRPLPL